MTETIKQHITWYGIFTMIMFIFQISSNFNLGFETFDLNFDLSITGIITGLLNFINLFFSLITFTIPNPDVSVFIYFVNGLLWISRLIIFLEILPYVKDLIKLF